MRRSRQETRKGAALFTVLVVLFTMSSLVATWGPGVNWRLVESPVRVTGKEGAPDPALAEVAEDPRVQAVLDIFGGTVESVKDN